MEQFMKDADVRWGKNTDFAEVAEALGIRTDQVVAVSLGNDSLMTLYTPFDDKPDETWSARLGRTVDGILVVTDTKIVPGFIEDLRKKMEKQLGENRQD
jgi:hypothetical protein